MLEPHTHKLVEEEASSLVLMVSRPVVAGRSRSHFLAAGPIHRSMGCRRTSDSSCYHSCLWPLQLTGGQDAGAECHVGGRGAACVVNLAAAGRGAPRPRAAQQRGEGDTAFARRNWSGGMGAQQQAAGTGAGRPRQRCTLTLTPALGGPQILAGPGRGHAGAHAARKCTCPIGAAHTHKLTCSPRCCRR